jgi:hypothetical protein
MHNSLCIFDNKYKNEIIYVMGNGNLESISTI